MEISKRGRTLKDELRAVLRGVEGHSSFDYEGCDELFWAGSW